VTDIEYHGSSRKRRYKAVGYERNQQVCHVHMDQKCQTAHQNMPNNFKNAKKAQTGRWVSAWNYVDAWVAEPFSK